MTPGGNVLDYNCNGFQAFSISYGLYISLSLIGIFDGVIIAKYFPQYLLISHSFGIFMTLFSYFKGKVFPSHSNDVRESGNLFLDLFSGIELNPRMFGVDFKLFFNGRPGITMWPIINFSFMIYQYRSLGHVSWGMAVLNWLQFLYCADYFWNENWYLKTIDIQTDAFGFYLAWGDCAWLPFMYTLQSQFISFGLFPEEHVSFTVAMILFVVGTSSYVMFRVANHQKKVFKDSDGKCRIWGRKAESESIPAVYSTSDGKVHHSKLMCSGLWGVCRRMNYTFDLIGSFCYCYCAVGGMNRFLDPRVLIGMFYWIFLLILLLHRLNRDNQRLHAKYGDAWEKYKKKVKYWLIPFVF